MPRDPVHVRYSCNISVSCHPLTARCRHFQASIGCSLLTTIKSLSGERIETPDRAQPTFHTPHRYSSQQALKCPQLPSATAKSTEARLTARLDADAQMTEPPPTPCTLRLTGFTSLSAHGVCDTVPKTLLASRNSLGSN